MFLFYIQVHLDLKENTVLLVSVFLANPAHPATMAHPVRMVKTAIPEDLVQLDLKDLVDQLDPSAQQVIPEKMAPLVKLYQLFHNL